MKPRAVFLIKVTRSKTVIFVDDTHYIKMILYIENSKFST